MRSRLNDIVLVSSTLFLASCGGDAVGAVSEPVTLASLNDVSAQEWQALASRRIFFGHQSVGRNMMTGIRELLEEHPEIGLRLVQADDPTTVEGPAFIDASIGENRKPATKARAFVEVVENGLGPDAIAMYKYCYVDVNADTDIDALFESYVAQTREIQRNHPEITLVHITLPLKTAPGGAKEYVKTLLGRPTEASLNMKRNRFNQRLREEFGGKAPIFDLARLESTRPDGTRSFTRHGGQQVFMLAPEWTYDNGHLNEAGRRYVAEQFLVMLAKIPSGQSSAPASGPASANPAQAPAS